MDEIFVVRIRREYWEMDLVWPKDWIKINIEVGNNREQALNELTEMMFDEGLIGVNEQGPAYAEFDAYLNENGITEDAWIVMMGQADKEITFVKRLHSDGGGFKVHIDKLHTDALNVGYGDTVEITMRRVD